MVKAVVGANWGDEGKGKITDMLAREADIIIRFQGGANAGHTIVNNYGKFALHTLPSGVFYNHTTSIIGNGVALNIPILMDEIQSITDRNVPMPKILVSDRAQIVMPYHILFDQYEEERLGGKSFGSTKSGIAPFYSDKYAKIGFQVSELFDEELLKEKIARVAEQKNVILEHLYHKPAIVPSELLETLHGYRDMIQPFVCDVSAYLDEAVKAGKNILLEGQLGTLKDPDHGIYPMVTSSSTLAAYGAIGAGIPPYEIKEIYTVCKAYSSSVGAGAFVSEIFGDEADELRRRGGDGGEYGATTGRPRRMGWFDCVASKYGCRLQGTTDVCFTVLDVLGYLDEIPVCTGYEIDGEVTTQFPVTSRLEKAKPVLTTLPGWKTDIRGIRNYDELPENCRKYVEFIEEQIGYPITLVSNGPARDDVIYRKSALKNNIAGWESHPREDKRMKKKALSLILASAMVLSLAACGSDGGPGDNTGSAGEETSKGDTANAETPDDGAADSNAASASDMNIAMITDSGDITDQSFNQTTYESCKAWAEINDVPFTYYKPDSDSDEARSASVDQAVAGGANVIVMPGYMFAAAVVTQPEMYPDVKFVALDVSAGDICEKGVGEGYTYNPADYNVTDYYNEANVYCCTYQEELSGYMAGYAAVKSGYKHLGFLGGMSVPAVTRFGYGYVQGIDAAAAELGIANEVEVEYVCGGQFYGDADITSAMDTWYGTKNVEVVFACGGGIYTSAAEAAGKVNGKVIGVDSDQQPVIDGKYGEGMTITSAMKGLSATVNTILNDIRDGKWSEHAGKIENLGMVSENPEENYVQLPIKSTQWSDAFTEEDYRALVKGMYNGEIKVSNDISAMPSTTVKVTDYGSIK